MEFIRAKSIRLVSTVLPADHRASTSVLLDVWGSKLVFCRSTLCEI
jgi:hypothetical protein